MEHISQALKEVRERYPKPTLTHPTSDPKAIEYHQQINERGYAPNPDCKACNGAGFVHPRDPITGKTNWGKTMPCEAPGCLAEAKAAYMTGEDHMQSQGVSWKPHTFENFEKVPGTESSFNAFYLLAHSLRPPFLLCYGNVGRGKTHLCEATARALNAKGIQTRYYTVAGIITMLKESITTDSTETVTEALSNYPALILDDWGVNYGTDWEMSKLEDIIDRRYRFERITVMTSNKDITELKTMSERIVSRFRDGELGKVVLNNAGDYRPGKKER